jgi:tRNA(Arg) A34 adenosine deaminase TadA
MKRAIEISCENVTKIRGGPFGCVIVRKNQIIAEGCNRVTQKNDPTAHAEIVAIRKACQKLKKFCLEDCILYTSCEPCPMCLAAIYWARIKTVYFANTQKDAQKIGFDDEWIYQELAKPMTKRKMKMKSLMKDEAKVAFEAWEKADQKIEY